MTARAVDVALVGITKRFGTTVALDEVDLRLRPGRIHALLGENGAGKSTLVGVAFGLMRPDQGDVIVDGTEISMRTPRAAIHHGIGMVQQHFSHVPAFTVAENVALGGRGRFDPRAAARKVRVVADAAGLPLDPFARVADLPIGAQQRLEIVRALAHDARVLIMDEPTAVLAPAEASDLLRWLRRFADGGGSVALVTHKVNEALAVADDITVLRAGKRVAVGAASTFTATTLARAMFPDAVPDARPQPPPRIGAGVLVTARRVSLAATAGRAKIREATFEFRAGEIIGVAAIEGAGQETLLRALAGLCTPAAGAMELPAKVSFIPGDRRRDALVLDFPLFENLALRRAVDLRGVVPWRAVRERTRAVIREFDVRADSESAPVHTLSGGNQQRFVVGRELAAEPSLVVAEEPTRGLDLVATSAVHAHLRRAAAAGAVVVVHSSDLDELLALSDRILVVHEGKVRELPVERDLVSRAMVGDA